MTPVETPTWKFRLDPALKDAALEVTKAEGDDISSVLRSALRAYVLDPQGFNAAIATIRGLAAVRDIAAPSSEPTP